VRAASGKVLVTTASLYARKIAPIRDLLPSLRHVIVDDDGTGSRPTPGRATRRSIRSNARRAVCSHVRSPAPPA
jgi:acetyl-CoA synthetase